VVSQPTAVVSQPPVVVPPAGVSPPKPELTQPINDPDEVELTIPVADLHRRLMQVENDIRLALRGRRGSQVRITWRLE